MRDEVPAWPPGASRSTSSVRNPSDAPYTAAASPAGPAPMMATSYSAAAGVVALKKIMTGEPIRSANAMAERLRAGWEDVLERHAIAGYVYGLCSTFHVYFETDPKRVREARRREDLHTTEAARLKGMPGQLVADYQRWLRHHGVDLLSGTGGVLSAVHTAADIEQAIEAFETTVLALRDEKQLLTLG